MSGCVDTGGGGGGGDTWGGGIPPDTSPGCYPRISEVATGRSTIMCPQGVTGYLALSLHLCVKGGCHGLHVQS